MNPVRNGRGWQGAGAGLIVLALLLMGYLSAHVGHDRPRSHHSFCSNNLKQISLSFRTWAIDNDGRFPFNVSTNEGGTREFCAVGSDGFDTNAALHFQVMSNELSTPKLLVCPKDRSRQPAHTFHELQATNISYQVRSGTNLNESNPHEVLVQCRFDGNTICCDGSFTGGKAGWKSPKSDWREFVRYNYLDWLSTSCPALMFTGVILLWVGSRVTWKAKGGPKPMGLLLGEIFLVFVALLFIWGMLDGITRP